MFTNETTAPEEYKNTGRRKISPEALIMGDELRRENQPIGIKKKDVLISFKNVACTIGLSELDILVVESLCRCTPPGAFEKGEEIIAVVSNEKLARWHKRDKRTIQRSLARLVNECVIIPAVGDDQKRRTVGGTRLGFDLSPLRWRVEEFRRLHEQEEAEARDRKAMRREVGRLRNACLQITDALADAEPFICEIKRLEARARRGQTLEAVMDAMVGLGGLKDALMQQLRAENQSQEAIHRMTEYTSVGDRIDTHQGETTLENVSKETTDKAPVYDVKKAPVESATPPDSALERKSIPKGQVGAGLTPKEGVSPRITPKKLVELVPELDVFCADPAHASWSDVDRAADQLIGHVKLNHRAWNHACETIGRAGAVLILVAVIAKAKSGKVRNPAGLFVRMAQMVAHGTATISSLFHGLGSDHSREKRTYH